MRASSSFQSILEQKLNAKSAAAAASSTTTAPLHSTAVDPAHLAFLMGSLNRSSFQKPLTKLYPSVPKPPPPPHALTSEQRQAAAFFAFHGAELTPAFTQKELKHAFRMMALRLHPDMNKGAVGPFIALKNHYEELLAVFSAPSRPVTE